MICKHNFHTVSEVTKPRDGISTMYTGVSGVEVVCVLCGQVRRAWADGKVQITNAGTKPIDEETDSTEN